MGLTRFHDRVSGVDGPISGALQSFYVPVPSVTNTSVVFAINLPAGQAFEVTDIMFTAAATGATPSMEVGTASSGEQIVAAVTLTTGLGACTIVDGTIPAGGDIFVTIICTASDTVTQGNVTISGFMTAPPTSVTARGYSP